MSLFQHHCHVVRTVSTEDQSTLYVGRFGRTVHEETISVRTYVGVAVSLVHVLYQSTLVQANDESLGQKHLATVVALLLNPHRTVFAYAKGSLHHGRIPSVPERVYHNSRVDTFGHFYDFAPRGLA